jgi:hypothetical protein
LSDEVATELQPGPHVFTVEYDGWQRDTQRIDASRARLRVYRDDAYFQFYTAIVSGIGLRAL